MPTLENRGLSGISLLPGKSNINCWPFAAFCFWHVKQLLRTLQRADPVLFSQTGLDIFLTKMNHRLMNIHNEQFGNMVL